MCSSDASELVAECAACGGTDLEPFLRDGPHTIVTCRNCGLKFVTPRADKAAVKRFFQNEYITDRTAVDETFTSPRRASLRREARRLKELRPEGGRLLDVGTASGAFLGEFSQDKNWQIEAIEPSPHAARRASERFRVPVHSGFLEDQTFGDATFDVVTSLDAFIMHAAPDKDAAEISRILKRGGYFALDIPGLNFRLLKGTGLGASLLYGGKTRLNVGVNLFYYTRATLTRLLSNHGFAFVASHPEQAPVHGRAAAKALNFAYFGASSLLYRLTAGRINYAPKEFIVYRKIG